MKRWFFFRSRPKTKNELKLIKFFIKKFGYKPKNLSIFQTALTHKSYSNIHEGSESNERLEFLGDTILDAIVANYLYHRFPNEDEGFLTQIKSKLVNRKTLSEVANKIGLSEFMIYQKGRGIVLDTIEGNAFEAVVGAIYLDGGYQAANRSMIHYIYRNYVDVNDVLESEIDFKSQLYILAQKNRLNLDFVLIKEEFNDGKWSYEVEVIINNTTYGIGKGSTKKMAEQAASKQTLELIG